MKCKRPTPVIHAAAAGGNCAARKISPVTIATSKKQATPIGTVSAIPWLGVPVTTPRRAAALLSAKVAAERRAKIVPSTRACPVEVGSTQQPLVPATRLRQPPSFEGGLRRSRGFDGLAPGPPKL